VVTGGDAPALVGRLAEHLRQRQAGADHTEDVGPFTVGLAAHNANPFYNYAVPAAGAEPTGADVRALIDAFRARERQPRIEYLADSAPSVAGALLPAGFVEERRLPVLARRVGPGSAGAPAVAVAGVVIGVVDADAPEDVAAACTVAHLAFREDGMPDEHDLQRLAGSLDSGGGAVLARLREGGEPVGSARYVAPTGGVAEVVGVAVLEDHRRRGIGASMMSALVSLAGGRGIDWLWLTPEDVGAGRVYERAAFRRVGDALHMSVPP
jgi:GNAT superfamily N-acetyltransferase